MFFFIEFVCTILRIKKSCKCVCNSLIFSGEYRNRTDDLLTASRNLVLIFVIHLLINWHVYQLPAGSIKGRIKVQLTEQFFNDPLSFAPLNSVNYVIPLIITQVENLDTILGGKPLISNPSRVVATDWEILPKDYTLYGIKFMNKYQATYLRRGVDVMTTSANVSVSSVSQPIR